MPVYLKCYIVTEFIVECNLSIKLKKHSFPDIHLHELFYLDVRNSLLKFVQECGIHHLYFIHIIVKFLTPVK
jgi:hypothetical protein